MKIKGNSNTQMEPAEFLAIIDLMKHTIDSLLLLRPSDRKKRMKENADDVIDDLFADDSEESYEESEEDSEEIVRPSPTPIPFEMKKAVRAEPPKPKLTPEMVEKGKEYFSELVELWRMNFGIEGTDQPDRGEEIRQLAISMKGPLVCHYVNEIGGLTLACQDVWKPIENCPDFNRTGTPRSIAENMQQVSSILFPPLAPFLEYPNPLEIEC